MVTKQEVMQTLEECIQTGTSAVSLYAKHVNNALLFSGFKTQTKELLANILVLLQEDSERHQKVYEDLLSQVKGSGKDVY